jgi:putative pyruvate formate lyase activating enzyme
MAFRLFSRDENAEKALPDYFAILSGKRTARYLAAKKTEVKGNLEGTVEDLLGLHEDAMKGMGRLSTDAKAVEKLPAPKTSLLDLKLELARRYFKKCNFCERMCEEDRTEKAGVCGVLESRITSEFLHHGEEPELVPSYTIFFAGCTFKCVFCQNWDISQSPEGGIIIAPEKVARMIKRQSGRARNTNWVGGDPTSNLKFILDVLTHSETNIPQVWNSNMYLTESSMQLLDGLIDVYLTDFKYGPGKCGKRLSKVNNYWDVVSRNHKLANEQAEMIVRHLVLPDHIECCTEPIMKWLAENLDTSKVRVNVMDQYRPEYNAFEHEELTRRLTTAEFLKALSIAKDLGLNTVD